MVIDTNRSGMADVPLKANLSRKSAFSCEACRKRKVKCNGASPSCSRCAARGDTCVYSLAPTLSYTKQLEARVAQLEDALSELRSQQTVEYVEWKGLSPSSTEEASLTPGFLNHRKGEVEGQIDQGLSKDFKGLNVEQDGQISFHGSTSLFQLPSGALNPASSSSHLAMRVGARNEILVENAWRERAFDQMATMPEPYQYLLDSHWCWIQPLFNFVYRPTFTRDMKINGPYYSDALLNAILSHSVRWCIAEPRISVILESFGGGADFYNRSVSGLFDSLKDGEVGIPTIQTLLLISAHECGQGNKMQAWLYGGMAFRMLDDLGISTDSRKYSDSDQLSDEDIEIRSRLFWSCYFWDKMLSLYFGRSPAIQSSQGCPPRHILDDTAELELWTPHGVMFPEGTHYPPTPAHSTSCFMGMCGLTGILNEILIHIYDSHRQISEAEFYSCVHEQSGSLSDWWNELPEYLKLIPANLPPYSPPSHIVVLNCVYHTVNILLHRPIICSKWNRESYDETHLVHCLASATSILSLFELYRNTFGPNYIVLSIAYSVYTASSIFLLEIQALKYAAPGTLDKLKFCIFALESIEVSNPVMSTALGLIYQEIQRLQDDLHIILPIPHPKLHQQRQQHSHPSTPHRGSPTEHSNHTSRHVSPVRLPHQPHPSSSISTRVAPIPTAGVNNTTNPVRSIYPFSRPVGFEMPPSNVPQLETTHLLGGMPNAAMTPDDPGSYHIAPEVFEAFSFAEPITTNMAMAPMDDCSWVRQT